MKLFGGPSRPRRVFRSGMYTDRGRVNPRNEDSCLVDEKRGLFAVADGMGGHPAGDVASGVAVDRLPALLGAALRRAPQSGGEAAIEQAIEQAVVDLNDAVYAEGMAVPERHGMGTTLVLLLLTGDAGYLAHVGDSRAYLLRADELHRLTEDQTVAHELVHSGLLGPGEASRHPFAHRLTQAVGTEGEVTPAIRRVELEEGDRLLLCSDGVSKMLDDTRIADLLGQHPRPGPASRALIDAANDAGGRDNSSAIIVDVVRV